jgi:hypothetical protein
MPQPTAAGVANSVAAELQMRSFEAMYITQMV